MSEFIQTALKNVKSTWDATPKWVKIALLVSAVIATFGLLFPKAAITKSPGVRAAAAPAQILYEGLGAVLTVVDIVSDLFGFETPALENIADVFDDVL